jgi:hypothetical protein
VPPKVNVGGVFGELENGKANHASNKRPLQKGACLCWRDFSLRHGRKIPVAAPDKSFLFTILDLRFTRPIAEQARA